jgi:putative ABC transport system permease protein
MRIGFHLALKSLLNRKVATTLSVLAIALSVALLLAIQTLRTSARQSFTGTVSQTDLIVGARGGALQLLLYSVFRIGSATNNIKVESWEHFRNLPSVAWTIPYSLGDSHRGYRVVATNQDFYARYHYRGYRSIRFREGRAPSAVFEVALGSDVAEFLHYKIGSRIALTHGVSATALVSHDDKPFTVTGILDRTGTPVDRSLYITLQGMEAIHLGWEDGGPPSSDDGVTQADDIKSLRPKNITAFLVGAKSRSAVLRLQREVNQFEAEPLMAIIPGVALAELWSTLGYAEQALLLVTTCVLVTGLFSMLVALYSTLNERRRELAVFRSVGMSRWQIAFLLVIEAQFCTLSGIVVGAVMAAGTMALCRPIVERQFGILLVFEPPTWITFCYCVAVLAAGTLAGLLPAWSAFRHSLNDGLAIRV